MSSASKDMVYLPCVELGNRTVVEDKLSNALTTYTYDAKSRLTQSNRTDDNSLNPIVYDYSYDANDDRLTSNETGPVSTFTYNAFGQLTTSTDGTLLTTYTYDSNGNLTVIAEEGSDPVTMGYDVENRMTVSEKPQC